MERTLILVKPDAFERGLTGDVIVRFERTETFFAARQKLDGVITPAFPAFETLDEAHTFTLLSAWPPVRSPGATCYSFDKGKNEKAPCQTSTGLFLNPFGAV